VVVALARPIAAIVGRPNVGKSTLVNRLAATRQAIVDMTAGVTRDRNYVEADWRGREFLLVDTGGLEPVGTEVMLKAIKDQALAAISEADFILFVVDGQSGLVPADEEIADILRKTKKPVLLVVNKVDNPADRERTLPFYRLGLGDPFPVSASHGLMIGDLLDMIIDRLPDVPQEDVDTEQVKIAIVGRPNAGKSSVFNRLVGSERAMVSEIPGTTRDAIDTVVTYEKRPYRFIDTAGLRRIAKLSGNIEYYGTLRAIKALEDASVAVLVVDCTVGVTDQDQRVARLAQDKHCALIILLNKWDTVDVEDAPAIEDALVAKLAFVDYAITLKTSAVTGRGLRKIFGAIDQVNESFNQRVSTPVLNKFLVEMRRRHIPTKKGKALKLKYITQLKSQPPTFLIFVNDPQIVDNAYKRFLDKNFRARFGLIGTPVNYFFRKGD